MNACEAFLADIGASKTAAELDAAVARANSRVSGLMSHIQAEEAKLAPLLAIPGASLSSIITWITAAVQPYIAANATLIQTAADLSACYGQITALEAQVRGSLPL